METVKVVAYPYARQSGKIQVPEGLSEKDKAEYVKEHWNEIEFSAPELDYCGTDFDID